MIRREQQRFSLRKYKVGVASVFLGTTLSFMMANGGVVKAAETTAQPSVTVKSGVVAEAISKEISSKQSQGTQATTEKQTTAVVPKTEEASVTSSSVQSESATTTNEPTITVTPTPASTEAVAGVTTESKSSETDRSASALEANKPKKRSRRSATAPDATSYTEGSSEATPTMSDPNGSTVSNRPLTIPTPKDPREFVTSGVNFQLNPTASQYTFDVTDLHQFNAKYHTKYYYRLSKPYDNSNNVTIELVDGNNNSVVETKYINGTGTVNLGQSVLAPLSGSSNAYIEFRYEDIKDADKTNRPALRATWKITGPVNNFDGPRSGIQIYDVVNSANEGTTITDPQYYIPRQITKTVYYKIVDKNSPSYNANRVVGKFIQNSDGSYVMNSSTAGDFKLVNSAGAPEVTTQSYKSTGNEESLGTYTITAMEGQNFHASALRAFDGYNLYQTADSNSLTGQLAKSYTVGQRWFDVANGQGGVKRIKEVVKEDGTVRIEMWAIKSDSLNKISKDLNTDGYVKVYETIIRPGSNNFKDHPEDLGIHPQINDPGWNAAPSEPFTIQPISSGNPGEFFSIGGQGAPFKINGVPVSSGNLFRLENTLKITPETVYYYVKQEPVTVIPEVEKQLQGRAMVNGEFRFKLLLQEDTKNRWSIRMVRLPLPN